MSDTTNIEKQSLEAHVELCAQRYRYLEEKLELIDENITRLDRLVTEMHGCVTKLDNKYSDKIIGWGSAIMVVMLSVIGWLATELIKHL